MDSVIMEAALGYHQFKINYSKAKDIGIGKWITSPKFHVGQHDWTIKCFPKGSKKNNKHVSVYLELCRTSVDVKAELGFILMDKHGSASDATLKLSSHTFTSCKIDWGFTKFIEITELEEKYIKNGCFVLIVSVGVQDESCECPFPDDHFTWLDHPPTVGNGSSSSSLRFPRNRIQKFRDENKQTDVTFDVSSKKFVAHRVILAAHSPVFEAELLGPMAESNLSCIIIKEMMPSIFKAMLDFIYNGSFSVNEELFNGDGEMSTISFLEKLLVAADRYAIEPLKDMCEHRLANSISLDTVVSLLELTEKHNCSELKKSCLQFVFDKEKSFSLMFNEGYFNLMQNYPSLLAELKEMAAKLE